MHDSITKSTAFSVDSTLHGDELSNADYQQTMTLYRKVPGLTALVKDDERGGQGHISTSVLHQSEM
jgi:hypothetical protein